MPKIADAILSLTLLKNDFFISAFPSKIIFGEITNFAFSKNKYFVFHRYQFTKFYLAICNILKSLAPESPQKGTIVNVSERENYFWSKIPGQGDDYFQIGIEIFDERTFVCTFSLRELNHLFHCFNELIFCCVLLRDFEIELLQKILALSLKEILDLSNDNQRLKIFLKENLEENVYNYENYMILVKNNIDIIILKYKLNSIIKKDILEPNLSPFLN